MIYEARVFFLGKPFRPTIIFVRKAGVYPSGAPAFRCSLLWKVPGLTQKHYNILERPAGDNNSSLFWPIQKLKL